MDSFAEAFDIPAYLGFKPVPRKRVEKYSVVSYRAQYMLTEEQAERLHGHCRTHQDMLREIYRLFSNDPEYRRRVRAGYPPHTGEVTQAEADKLMQKLGKTPWSEVGREMA